MCWKSTARATTASSRCANYATTSATPRTRGQYKIYIIDEVHMLTSAAFNALLKTLEEPPEHVKFIFATTEVQKVLPTILSPAASVSTSGASPRRSSPRTSRRSAHNEQIDPHPPTPPTPWRAARREGCATRNPCWTSSWPSAAKGHRNSKTCSSIFGFTAPETVSRGWPGGILETAGHPGHPCRARRAIRGVARTSCG